MADRLLNEAKSDAKAYAVVLKARQLETAKAVEDARKKVPKETHPTLTP